MMAEYIFYTYDSTEICKFNVVIKVTLVKSSTCDTGSCYCVYCLQCDCLHVVSHRI